MIEIEILINAIVHILLAVALFRHIDKKCYSVNSQKVFFIIPFWSMFLGFYYLRHFLDGDYFGKYWRSFRVFETITNFLFLVLFLYKNYNLNKKSKMKKFREHWKDLLLLLFATAIIVLIFRGGFTSDDLRVVTDLPTYNEVQEVKQKENAKSGAKYSEKQYRPAPSLAASGIPKSKYDSILNVLGVSESKVNALTIAMGKYADSIKIAKIERDEANNKVWHWEKTLQNGSKSIARMSEKDSVLYEEHDLRVAAIDRQEGKGKKKQYFTDFYPLDSAYKFNGAYVFRQEARQRKDILQGDLVLDFQKGILNQNSDQLNGRFELLFFPDNGFSFGAGAGALYYFQNGQIFPFWSATIRKNLFRATGR